MQIIKILQEKMRFLLEKPLKMGGGIFHIYRTISMRCENATILFPKENPFSPIVYLAVSSLCRYSTKDSSSASILMQQASANGI
jgi:hypothetical protein